MLLQMTRIRRFSLETLLMIAALTGSSLSSNNVVRDNGVAASTPGSRISVAQSFSPGNINSPGVFFVPMNFQQAQQAALSGFQPFQPSNSFFQSLGAHGRSPAFFTPASFTPNSVTPNAPYSNPFSSKAGITQIQGTAPISQVDSKKSDHGPSPQAPSMAKQPALSSEKVNQPQTPELTNSPSLSKPVNNPEPAENLEPAKQPSTPEELDRSQLTKPVEKPLLPEPVSLPKIPESEVPQPNSNPTPTANPIQKQSEASKLKSVPNTVPFATPTSNLPVSSPPIATTTHATHPTSRKMAATGTSTTTSKSNSTTTTSSSSSTDTSRSPTATAEVNSALSRATLNEYMAAFALMAFIKWVLA
ncbi:hypothetical protein K7432_014285 [Basidiobolus ranarum]|uniref:Uncharacterized protein n=1 Tax=Basidiobolus ranarum TaxID=34480 RepID=A0ABR2WHT8_9FUNG